MNRGHRQRKEAIRASANDLNKAEPKITPLPWAIGDDGDVFGGQGTACVTLVCGGPDEIPEAKANAAYIVKSCNAHEELVRLAQEMAKAKRFKQRENCFNEASRILAKLGETP